MKQFATKAILKARSLTSKKAEGYIDTAVKILIAVVVGAILLFALIALYNNIVVPTVTSKVTSLFAMDVAA